jgi:hypothetical protein
MDNAALRMVTQGETGWILRGLAARLESGDLGKHWLRDVNGNEVGIFEIRE